MGLEQVKKEILQKAEQEAKQIAGRGSREAEEIIRKAKAELDQYRKSTDEDLNKLFGAMEKKSMASADFDVKKMKLDRKKEMIDRVFSNVEKSLGSMSESRKEANMKKLLAKAKKEIDVKYVHANPGDGRIVRKLSGVEYRETDIIGGMVAESHDLNFSVDLSYDELLGEVRKKYLQEISQKLFG